MFTSYLMIAEGGLTWTPETFYVAATVVHLVIILGVFRLTALSPDYNTFVNAIFVAVPANLLAYFTKDLGVVGVLVTGAVLFGLLAAIARGDVLKALLVWVAVVASYWAMAFFIVPVMAQNYFDDPRQADIQYIAQELGSIPQVLIQGGMEAEPLTEEDYERLRSRGDEEE